MNLLVRSCAVRPTVCLREDKRIRFCLMKGKTGCELFFYKNKGTLKTTQCVFNVSNIYDRYNAVTLRKLHAQHEEK